MEIRQGYKNGLHYDVIDIAAQWNRPCETIIFHHGVGADREIWAEWVPLLADRYRIVRFDMRGMGKSREALDERGLPFELLVQDVLTVADAAEAGRFHLVGESIGGTVALALGLAHPERTRTIIASNTAHIGSEIRNLERWESVLTEQGGMAWSAMMMPDRFYPDAITAAKWSWYEQQQGSHPVAAILAGLRSLVGTDLREEVGTLQAPVLLLQADASPFVSIEMMADLHARLPDSEIQVFAYTRHGLPYSHPAPCARLLREFLVRRARAEGKGV